MPLSTYDELQTSILSWLARPGDPLVSPAVPDMIQLFEREATRRLKVGGAEKRASLTALSAAVALPADFGELRLATSGGVILTYVTPMQLPDGGGPPAHYTIVGNEMRLGPSPTAECTIEIVYQGGVPPLSDTNASNWLLAQHPDCYLFGSLVEAESFIGSDDRIPLWAQRREAAFASIETADRKARWGGAPLSIRAEGVSGGNGTAAGDWTSAPPVPIPIASIVAGDGLTGGGTEGIVTVSLATPVAVSRGGTGGTTALDARMNLGAAPLDSPALIGNPTAPTSAPGDNDTSIATTGFVTAALVAQALAGDVTGPTSTTAVVRLQGRPVAGTAPTSLQVLQWSGTNWAPATIAAGGTLTGVTAGTGITVSGAAPSPTVALTVPVSVANGGTGSTTAAAALTALGAAPLAGPVFTGDARAVTPATADNDTSIATTAYVQAQGYATATSVTAGDALRVLKAGDTMSGGLNAPALAARGAASVVLWDDRATPGAANEWGWYGNAGAARLYSAVAGVGNDRVVVTTAGGMTVAGALTTPSLSVVSAADGSILARVAGLTRAVRIGADSTYAIIEGVDQTGGATFQPLRLSGSTINLGAGITCAAPTGGDKGVGTINATAVYQNNVLLTSDAEAKRDIEPLSAACLSLVTAVEPKSFRWREAEDPETVPEGWAEKRRSGFLAQDLSDAEVPGIVEGKPGEMVIDVGAMLAVLWQAVRELSAKVESMDGAPTLPRRRQ